MERKKEREARKTCSDLARKEKASEETKSVPEKKGVNLRRGKDRSGSENERRKGKKKKKKGLAKSRIVLPHQTKPEKEGGEKKNLQDVGRDGSYLKKKKKGGKKKKEEDECGAVPIKLLARARKQGLVMGGGRDLAIKPAGSEGGVIGASTTKKKRGEKNARPF